MGLLKGQDRTQQLSEGMGASFSRSYSAWKSQFANVFHALSLQEKLQGEARQTCLRTRKAVSESFLTGHQEVQGDKAKQEIEGGSKYPQDLPLDNLEFVPV